MGKRKKKLGPVQTKKKERELNKLFAEQRCVTFGNDEFVSETLFDNLFSGFHIE